VFHTEDSRFQRVLIVVYRIAGNTVDLAEPNELMRGVHLPVLVTPNRTKVERREK
jgi:hypothetical protein